MLTLSLETALDGFSVALHYDKELLSSRFEPQARLASGRLLPMIESVLKEASSALGELTHLGVGRGPGSFTGIRLGLATVQALALGLKIPLITVTSFEVIASAFQLAHPHLVEDPIPTWLVVDTKGFQLGVARVSFFEGSIYEPH